MNKSGIKWRYYYPLFFTASDICRLRDGRACAKLSVKIRKLQTYQHRGMITSRFLSRGISGRRIVEAVGAGRVQMRAEGESLDHIRRITAGVREARREGLDQTSKEIGDVFLFE